MKIYFSNNRVTNQKRCYTGPNKKEHQIPNKKLKGNLSCRDQKRYFKILWALRKTYSMFTSLEFWRADFGLF